MNTRKLVEEIAKETGATKVETRDFVDLVFECIAKTAAKGEEVSIYGFGKFKVKQSAAREGRHPVSGKPIKIAAAKKLTFAPATAMKKRLNG